MAGDHAYALTLFTEASLDLAEDDELMELLGRAGFQSVFIGIESPNEESLRETKKLQNVRERAGTLLERVHRVQGHGLDVWCGMIVGFDSDNPPSSASFLNSSLTLALPMLLLGSCTPSRPRHCTTGLRRKVD